MYKRAFDKERSTHSSPGTQISFPESLMYNFIEIFNSFIKVSFTYHKIRLFQSYNSIIFSKFTELCNHYHNPVVEHFRHSQKSPLYLFTTNLHYSPR